MDLARFWDKRADGYAKSAIRDVENYERTLERTRSRLGPADRVLEIGCGSGNTAVALAPSVATYLATDVSGRMVEIGHDRAEAEGMANLAFQRATLDDGLEGHDPFDAVLAFNLLHLLRDLPSALGRIHTLLRPGGLLVSKTFCMKEQSRLWAIPLWLARAVGQAPYVSLLRVADLEAAMVHAGFEIVEAASYPPGRPHRFVVARRSG